MIAMTMGNTDKFYTRQTITNACCSTFASIKQNVASLVIAPRAIQRLAKNRNVESVIHRPNIG
jgi:hypothetical protein